MALEAIDPTTEVTTSGVGRVAGRDVYELVLTPSDPQTLVARVTLAMDAGTNTPLRVRLYATTIPDPAYEVGFSSVDYGSPDPARAATESSADATAAAASRCSCTFRARSVVSSSTERPGRPMARARAARSERWSTNWWRWPTASRRRGRSTAAL